MFAKDKILGMMSDGQKYSLGFISETVGITKPYTFILLRELVNEELVGKIKRGTYQITNPDEKAVALRIKAEIKESLANVRTEISDVETRLDRL